MNVYMVLLLQAAVIVSTIIYGVFAYKIFTRPGYKDDDSSVIFSVSLLLSGVFAFGGFFLFSELLFDGFVKLIIPSHQINVKQQSGAIIAVTIFLTYSFLIIRKGITNIKSIAYQKGLDDAKELLSQKEVFNEESELEDYDEKALVEAIQRMRVDIEEDERINGRKSKEQILKEREEYLQILVDLAAKQKKD